MPHLGSGSLEETSSCSKPPRVRLSRTLSDSSSQLQRPSAYVSLRRLREASSSTDPFLTGVLSPPPSDEDEFNSPKRLFSGKDSRTGIHSPPDSESGDLPSLNHGCDEVDGSSSSSFSQFGKGDELCADLRRSKESGFLSRPIQPIVYADFIPSGAISDWDVAKLNRRRFSTGNYSTSLNTDRYIADRDGSQSPFETFRLSKSPHKLSTIEKLLRQNSASPDPFAPSWPARAQGRALPSLVVRNGIRVRPLGTSGTNVTAVPREAPSDETRVASIGAVWNVSGNTATSPPGPIHGIPDGRGGLLGSGTNAPMYKSNFAEGNLTEQDHDCFEGRLAAALDIDQNRRMFNSSQSPGYGTTASSDQDRTKRKLANRESRTKWIDGQWILEGSPLILDAPLLRDDYYCSVLAYCYTSRTLAVGLSNRVYLWSEAFGVQNTHLQEPPGRGTFVSCLSFSSDEGGHSILAIGRSNGNISLWSLFDSGQARFHESQPSPVSCVAFKPVVTRRRSERFGSLVSMEELLVGDEAGVVYYYSVEWMSTLGIDIHGWRGAMNLMAKISVHEQQICGLAWSREGDYFATGANDNMCCLFEVKDIFAPLDRELSNTPCRISSLRKTMTRHGLRDALPSSVAAAWESKGSTDPDLDYVQDPQGRTGTTSRPESCRKSISGYETVTKGQEKHKWIHSAAIKAIAFCPWQRGLLATGGGSNDRAIHFYHTFSGACLATIDVQAQVTSLIWSTSRREIAATFGYAQPEHPYRIAVFSWPECKQIVAIPWATEARALLAIPYPGGPNETNQQAGEGETWWSRTAEEGCIVVACSDESVKFHEVWSGMKKATGGQTGLLGGSDILEGLAGIEREGTNTIR